MDKLASLFETIRNLHTGLIKNAYPWILDDETLGVWTLLINFRDNGCSEADRSEVKDYIMKHNAIDKDDILRYTRVLSHRLMLSDCLLSLYAAVTADDAAETERCISASAGIIDIFSAEVIDIYSETLLDLDLIKAIPAFARFLNTALIVTLSTGNRDLGARIITLLKSIGNADLLFTSSELQSEADWVRSHFGKVDQSWYEEAAILLQ
jgi:hypothetical protein